MSRYFRAEIRDNLPLNNNNLLLTIRPLERVADPDPGQFYMIEVGESLDPLLKRPFSYFRKTAETIQFVYTVRGKGTSLMKELKRGKEINVIGPLGTCYPAPGEGQTPLLIAGGIGMASLFPLAEAFGKRALLIYGARMKDELVMLGELESVEREVITCTDDCSFGKEGLVTDILTEFLKSGRRLPAGYLIYACGPRPMLAAVAEIAVAHGMKGYVSLEENMACGFGACMGCAVKTISGYSRVCKEGPVFPIDEIVW